MVIEKKVDQENEPLCQFEPIPNENLETTYLNQALGTVVELSVSFNPLAFLHSFDLLPLSLTRFCGCSLSLMG